MNFRTLTTGLMLLATVTTAVAEDHDLMISGDIAVESRRFVDSPQFDGQFDGVQASVIINPEFRLQRSDNQYSFIPFLRLDSRDDERSHFDLREAYWLHIGEAWEFLVGANKVFWGVTESRHLVDIINQTDFVEDIDDEDKLGQPMINAVTQRDWGRLSFFVMPYFRERTFPGEDGRLRFALPVDEDAAEFESGAEERHIDFALRYSHFVGDWDIGAYYFFGTGREPRLLPNASGTRLVPFYDLIQQFGVDLQYTREAWLWKFEGIVREGQGDTFGALVGGFEYTLYQIFESPADLGLLFEYLHDGRDNDPTRAPTTSFDDDIFIGARLALNDEQDTGVLGGAIVDSDDQSTFWFLEVGRRMGQNWNFELEGRFFANVDKDNPVSSFKDDSFLTIRLSYGF